MYSTPDLGVMAFNFSAQLSATHWRSAAVSRMAEGVVPLCSRSGMCVEPSSAQSKKSALLDSSASDPSSSVSVSSSIPPASADKPFAYLQTLSRLRQSLSSLKAGTHTHWHPLHPPSRSGRSCPAFLPRRPPPPPSRPPPPAAAHRGSRRSVRRRGPNGGRGCGSLWR